jgi:hypothetical protein
MITPSTYLNFYDNWSLLGLVMIDVEFGRENHSLIPATAIGGF